MLEAGGTTMIQISREDNDTDELRFLLTLSSTVVALENDGVRK